LFLADARLCKTAYNMVSNTVPIRRSPTKGRINMTSERAGISAFISGMVLVAVASGAGLRPYLAGLAHTQRGGSIVDSQIDSRGPAPSEAEIHERTQKLIENQHADDDADELYARTERHIEGRHDSPDRVVDDKTYRVVPTGAGTQKLLLREGDKPVDAAVYNREMRSLQDFLRAMADPNDSRAKAALAKRQKRERDRAEFVNATKDAFLPKWLAAGTRNGRPCDVFELDPNPNFHPHSILQDALVHVTAKIWVDRETDQIARGEAYVMSDISVGGGLLGKVYRGSRVSMEQAEIGPGIWLPTHYQYDFAGRKFLFSFQDHETIEVGHYRRVGPPKEALVIVEGELASGKTYFDDP
jgi:hypothetical protein